MRRGDEGDPGLAAGQGAAVQGGGARRPAAAAAARARRRRRPGERSRAARSLARPLSGVRVLSERTASSGLR